MTAPPRSAASRIDIPFIGELGVITRERETHRWRQCQQSASLRMPHPAVALRGARSGDRGELSPRHGALARRQHRVPDLAIVGRPAGRTAAIALIMLPTIRSKREEALKD